MLTTNDASKAGKYDRKTLLNKYGQRVSNSIFLVKKFKIYGHSYFYN